MGDKDDGLGRFRPERENLRFHPQPGVHVECAEWFVHQHEIRLHDPALRQRRALSHPATQLIRIQIPAAVQADAFEPRSGEQCSLASVFASECQAKLNVVQYCFPGKQRVRLEHVSGARIEASQRLTEHLDAAAVRGLKAGNDVQECGLSAPARSDDRHEGSCRPDPTP
jgi:hypothetical protein